MNDKSQMDTRGDLISTLENLVVQLREMEKKNRESVERFRLMADFALDWEYWHDPDGNFIYTSPSCESITGFTPEDFSNQKDLLLKIIHPEDMENWRTHSHTMMANGEVEAIEFRIKTKFGEIRWIHHVCRTVYDRDGKNRGVRGSNRDITKRKLMEKEIKILKGFISICASCKKIRDDKGYWERIESYIQKHSEAEFSHGICPECAKKLYPELDLYKNKE